MLGKTQKIIGHLKEQLIEYYEKRRHFRGQSVQNI